MRRVFMIFVKTTVFFLLVALWRKLTTKLVPFPFQHEIEITEVDYNVYRTIIECAGKLHCKKVKRIIFQSRLQNVQNETLQIVYPTLLETPFSIRFDSIRLDSTRLDSTRKIYE